MEAVGHDRVLHPFVAAILPGVSGTSLRQQIADQVAHVAATAGPSPTREALHHALAAHLWLLERANSADGVPLTAAGWMKPAVLTEFMTVLPQAAEWNHSATREIDVTIVWHFREFLQQERLLRKFKNSLRPTAAGEAALADPAELWVFLTERLVPVEDRYAGGASALLLLEMATEGDQRDEIHRVAEILAVSGWPGDLESSRVRDLWPIRRQLKTRVHNVGPRPQKGSGQKLSAAALAMVRDAVLLANEATL